MNINCPWLKFWGPPTLHGPKPTQLNSLAATDGIHKLPSQHRVVFLDARHTTQYTSGCTEIWRLSCTSRHCTRELPDTGYSMTARAGVVYIIYSRCFHMFPVTNACTSWPILHAYWVSLYNVTQLLLQVPSAFMKRLKAYCNGSVSQSVNPSVLYRPAVSEKSHFEHYHSFLFTNAMQLVAT